MNTEAKTHDLNRRQFLRGGSWTSLMMLMGGVPLKAQEAGEQPAAASKPTSPPVNCAVIGCGPWGRDILKTLSVMPNAPVVAVCDTYAPFLRRGKTAAPKAEAVEDYRKVLEAKEVQAVIIATPTPTHREIVEAAFAAGKHVYCEAPIAHNVEDARGIADAAKRATRLNFQSGLQGRSDPEFYYTHSFIQSGAMGRTVMGRGQWHKKQSWRRPSPNPEREKEANWHLRSATSAGLLGEIGVHQLDLALWYIGSRPVAANGFGYIHLWRDGRDIPDTVQAVLEFPDQVNYLYHATLANSFDASYDIFQGTDSAIMLRDRRAWMFKEVDAPLLGWEVYAKKEAFYRETGIVLASNATKLDVHVKGNQSGDNEVPVTETSLYYALEAFVVNSHLVGQGVKDFIASFGDDEQGLKDYLNDLKTSRLPAASYKEGYEATVAAIKTHDAVMKNQRLVFKPDWFEV